MKSTLHPVITSLLLGSLWTLTCCGEQPSSGEPGRASFQSRDVEVIEARIMPMERVVRVAGSLAPYERSTLSAKVPGRLESLFVDVGTTVEKGQMLAQIEARDYELRVQQSQAEIAQARAALGLPLEGDDDQIAVEQVSLAKQAHALMDEARKNRERVIGLTESGVMAESELESATALFIVAQSRYDAALDEARERIAFLSQRRAEYELAEKQLADTSIRAPFSGAIQSRQSSLGEFVSTGTPIVTLVKLDPLRLRLEVPERQSSFVAVGQDVRISIEGDDTVARGVVARLAPSLSDRDRTLFVEADVPLQGKLRPGLFARAEIVIDSDDRAVCVLSSAITVFAGIKKVVFVRSGEALEKSITTGRQRGEWVEVLSGVAEGDRVVLNPEGLRTGQLVSVVLQESIDGREAPTANDESAP